MPELQLEAARAAGLRPAMKRNIDCGYVVGKFPEDTYDNYISATYDAVKKVMLHSQPITVVGSMGCVAKIP